MASSQITQRHVERVSRLRAEKQQKATEKKLTQHIHTLEMAIRGLHQELDFVKTSEKRLKEQIATINASHAKELQEKLDYTSTTLKSEFERRLTNETERIREEERAKYVEVLQNYQKLSDPHGINWYFWYLCFMDVEIPSSPAWMVNGGSPNKPSQLFRKAGLGLKPVGRNHGMSF